MADAKQDKINEEPKFMYSWQSEDGEKQETNAQEFSPQGKKAYSRLAELGKKREELMDSVAELDILASAYHQFIQQNEINPPAENGEDTSVIMEEANEIAEEASKEE